MQKKYVLVECTSNINDVIKLPLQQTQRIKFTSFDVTANFLVFGASSGGLYVFSRHSCKFIKVIPSKEGAVLEVSAAPDDKAVALWTKKGAVIIVENCFCDSNMQFQLYAVKEYGAVTCMKWCLNDLYCGHVTGRISVIPGTNLLPKAIFRTTCESLMQLDSSVVQLDAFSKYLLVSTRTRTYLCNIEQEEYRQIGKKLRDGNFGACFYNTTALKATDVKIYCARPGCRLWETDFDCNVACTHQFRDSLTLKASNLIHLGDGVTDGRLNVAVFPETLRISDSFSFGKVHVINEFILTFNDEGLYIFDINTVSLVFWCSVGKIKDLKVFGDFVYVWTENSTMKCFRLAETDKLILKLLSQKQYYMCAELCVFCKDDVLYYVQNDKLHLITVLREKLPVNADQLQALTPAFEKIKECNVATARKLNNGIYVVDNVHCHENGAAQTLNMNRNNQKAPLSEVRSNSCEQLIEKSNVKVDGVHEDAGQNEDMDVLYVQYQLNKINGSVETEKLTQLLRSRNLDEMAHLFTDFPKYVVETKGEDETDECKSWCDVQFLNYVTKERLDQVDSYDVKGAVFEVLSQSFVSLNSTDDKCVCSFALPASRCRTPRYYLLGCEILKKNWFLNKSADICKSVPHMYKYLIGTLRKNEDIATLLPILLQYSDLTLFSEFCDKFSYDTWDSATKLLAKLKKSVCLNCERSVKFDVAATMSWTDFGKRMVRSIGAVSSVKLLTRYSKCIPAAELDGEFYRACIFTSIAVDVQKEDRCKAFDFLERVEQGEGGKGELGILMAKYLNRKYMGQLPGRSLNSRCVCSVCEMSTQSAILEEAGVTKLPCGHLCHVICSGNKQLCKVCNFKA